ncbi:hypothetical protein NQD34_005149 [Periophthalmus magnuspinnatus]|nr:hypothetical protein NQD34_005149 [Periophthalmus magnuspinnatus]
MDGSIRLLVSLKDICTAPLSAIGWWLSIWICLRCLHKIVTYYGVPIQMQTDNGTHFTGSRVKEWAADNNVEWIYHIPYYPQAAGLIERMNGMLKTILKKESPDNTLLGWRARLQECNAKLNNRPLGSGVTPMNRMIKVEPETDMTIKMWKLRETAEIPQRRTAGSAGLDLRVPETHTLLPLQVQVIDLGLGLQCPKGTYGTYGHIVPKASMALKGMTVDAGVLDPDFKGTLVVICKNNTDEPLVIKQGQAIAQLLIRPYVTGAVQEVQMPSTLVEGETPKIDKAGAKVWVKQPDGPPKAGEVIAQGEDSTVAVMYPGEEKWVNVPISKCYLREN